MVTPPLRTFATPWYPTPPTEGIGIPNESGSHWYFDGYAEGDPNLGPQQDMKVLFERAAANAPLYGVGHPEPSGAGVTYPDIDEGFNAPTVAAHVHHRNVVNSVQGHVRFFDDAVRARAILPVHPYELLERVGFPWNPERFWDSWWEYEGVLGENVYPPPISTRSVALDVEGARMAGAPAFNQPNRTTSTTLRVRWVDPGRCVFEPDPFSGVEKVYTTKPPFPLLPGTPFREIFVPAEEDNITVVTSPSSHEVPLGGGFFGYELTTTHVEGQVAAFEYSLVSLIAQWRYRLTWPRWRFFWREIIPLPPLRQLQRGDGLVIGDGRQYVRGNPSSTQRSVRQLWQGTFL